eukprot:4556831-Prymnesium_polylepis.1
MLEAKLDATDDLAALVMTSLWGNLADLSVSAGAVLVSPEKVRTAHGAALTQRDATRRGRPSLGAPPRHK